MGEWVSGEKREESESVLSVKKSEEKEKRKIWEEAREGGPLLRTISAAHPTSLSPALIHTHIQYNGCIRPHTR